MGDNGKEKEIEQFEEEIILGEKSDDSKKKQNKIIKAILYGILVLLAIISLSFVLGLNILTIFYGWESPFNISFDGTADYTLNLTIFKSANVTSATMNLSGHYKSYYLTDHPTTNTGTDLTNITGSLFGTTILGQNISIINQNIDKISWRWRCESENCDGNISYKVRYVGNKSILSECNMLANVSSSAILRECDFINFNTGNENVIITIERSSQQNTTQPIDVRGDFNNKMTFWGQQWSYYGGRNPPEWEVFPYDQFYYIINITFIDGTNYIYPQNTSIYINNTSIWSYLGEFNQSNNQTSNFASVLNTSLNGGACDCVGCQAVSSNCTIPFNFSSQSAGILNINSINISWYESSRPNLTITNPIGLKTSQIVTYMFNFSENYEISLCTYWVTLTSGTIIIPNTTINCDGSSGTFDTSLDANFIFNLFINDTSGNSNYNFTNFSVNTAGGSGSSSPGGGGGGGTKSDTNKTWTMTTQEGAGKDSIQALPGRERTKSLIFENVGDESLNIQLSCEDLGFDKFCDYVTFEENQFNLPLSKEIKTRVKYTILPPEDIKPDVYEFNIIARDDSGKKGVVTVEVEISSSFFDVVFTKLLFSSKLGIPYFMWFFLLIIPLLTFILNTFFFRVFLKDKGGLGLSIIFAIVIGFLLLSLQVF